MNEYMLDINDVDPNSQMLEKKSLTERQSKKIEAVRLGYEILDKYLDLLLFDIEENFSFSELVERCRILEAEDSVLQDAVKYALCGYSGEFNFCPDAPYDGLVKFVNEEDFNRILEILPDEAFKILLITHKATFQELENVKEDSNSWNSFDNEKSANFHDTEEIDSLSFFYDIDLKIFR